MARWTASAKWGEAPALDGQRDMPLALRLSEWLGHVRAAAEAWVVTEPPERREKTFFAFGRCSVAAIPDLYFLF